MNRVLSRLITACAYMYVCAGIAALLAPMSATAADISCSDRNPCIVKAVSANIRYYNQSLGELSSIKKKAFNKLLPADGILTKGRELVDGLSMLKIVPPNGSDVVLVEETAFELTPVKKIDCSGIANAILGDTDDYTKGVSVGLGNPCLGQ